MVKQIKNRLDLFRALLRSLVARVAESSSAKRLATRPDPDEIPITVFKLQFIPTPSPAQPSRTALMGLVSHSIPQF